MMPMTFEVCCPDSMSMIRRYLVPLLDQNQELLNMYQGQVAEILNSIHAGIRAQARFWNIAGVSFVLFLLFLARMDWRRTRAKEDSPFYRSKGLHSPPISKENHALAAKCRTQAAIGRDKTDRTRSEAAI